MLKLLLLWVVLSNSVHGIHFSTLDHLRSKTPAETQIAAAADVIRRTIGERASDFEVSVDASIGPKNRDTFKLMSSGSKISITGTSGVAVAMGFYYYLKYYAGGQVTWAGKQVDLPAVLPPIPASGETITSNDQFRYYQNVCTVSYSMAWWDWSRWEREIDWMALQGINLPLAFTGQEAIFQRVYMEMGFTMKDLNSHFGGPAFLAWARMGNIHGWGGPLTQTWLDNRLILQHKILQRMRSLGMTPALPGFAGHVPAAITRLYPQAKVSRLGSWGNFGANYSETYLLDFSDPLFAKIGGKFIKEMEYEFGVDHIYQTDTFNEMTPRSSDPSYLASAAKSVFDGMLAGDSQAIWLMQGWLFMETGFWKPPQIKALVTGVPQGRMIVLDLISELFPIYARTESYYGQPFIWCMLHNFGGTMEFYGAIDNVNKGPFSGRSFTNSTMIGTGLTPEGINQNEVMYEFMNEQAWRKNVTDISQWVVSFQAQRYGSNNDNAAKAWQLLMSSVYNVTSGHMDFHNALYTKRPGVSVKEYIWFSPETLYQAWDNIVMAANLPALADKTLFRYDLVDITRNSLQILSVKYYSDLMSAKTNASIEAAGAKMLDLLSDLETLLASDSHFLLGLWTGAAFNFSTDIEDTLLYDMNSRNQVTLWGPTGQIRDYAAKQWSGLIDKYYKPRWKLFIDMYLNASKSGAAFSPAKYDQACLETVEIPFSYEHTTFPITPTGDSIALAAKFHQKYRSETRSKFFSQFPNKPSPSPPISRFPKQWGYAIDTL